MIPHQYHVSEKPIAPSALIPVVVPSICPPHDQEQMTLCNWLFGCGERVEQGEDLLEISLPGIVCDVPSPVSGRLERIDRLVSETLQPGDVCGWIRCERESTPGAATDIHDSENDS